MLYRIPLLGNPNIDIPLRNNYIAAFGSACYLSEVNTFDCFYKTWQKACADAVKISEVWGGVPYDTGYTCQPVGNGDYTLQVGADVALKITINYQKAPRQTPLIDVNGTPTAVNGPYRNLTEPQKLGPGEDFYCSTVDKNGVNIKQVPLILQANRNAHGGKIYSDLPGFTYPCTLNKMPTTCMEPFILEDPNTPVVNPADRAEVHHVVPRNDKRGCAWGTNSNANAAVVSRRLNRFLWHNEPPAIEVTMINSVAAYAP